MATIPRAKQPLSIPRSPASPRAPRVDVSSGLNNLAQVTHALAENMLQQERANTVAEKKIEIYSVLGELESDVTSGKFSYNEDIGFRESDKYEGSYARAPEAFTALSDAQRKAILNGVTDPAARAAIANEFDMVRAQKLAMVRNSSVKKMRDQTVAELDLNSELFARSFVKATTEQEKKSIVQSFQDSLSSAVQTGAITRTDLVKRSQDFRNTVAELGVRSDLLNATRDIDGTEAVLNRLRSADGYAGLTPEARQKFEEQAQRQFNSAIDYQFRMEERKERLAKRDLEKRQLARTRELAALIRPVNSLGYGEPEIGHVEIDRAFQGGQIDAAQTNYLRSLLERPDPTPDPITRFTYVDTFTEQAHAGELNFNDVLRARAAGYIEDNDVQMIDSIHQGQVASGGVSAATDSKQALEFVTSYLFGVKSLFNIQLTDDKIQRLGAVELLFNGRVSRGENPYRVARELIEEDSRASITPQDVPPQVQDMFREHKNSGTLSMFWDEARTKIEEDDTLTLTQRRALVQQMENLKNEKGKALSRLPEVINELEIRANIYDRNNQ